MRLLGAIWVLPAAVVVWLLYLLPFWFFGLLKVKQLHPWVIEFRPMMRYRWYDRLWSRWGGHAMPFAIVLKNDYGPTRRHELRHCDQWLVLGVLFPLIYLALLPIYGYRLHPLERDAERYAHKDWR